MSHKLTPAAMFADVARTRAALPEADWNEQTPEAHPCSHHGHHGNTCPDAEKPRTGRATWGPRDRVEYRPRWTADHHPWAAIGPSGEPNGIRYSNQEVEEDEPEPAPRKVLGWFVPAHIHATTGEGVITLQCEHGHAEGIPERRLDGPRFGDVHIGAFLRAHAHGTEIRAYSPPKD